MTKKTNTIERDIINPTFSLESFQVGKEQKAPKIIIDIAKSIKKEGGRILIIGGAVRDEFLGLTPKDYDLEVHGLKVSELEKSLKSFGEINTIGKQFGILKIFNPHFGDIDISIPRRDSKIGAGHKGFEVKGDPYLSIKEAARRRDLTINSMAKDPITGEIYDPFGGLKDIKNGTLRATDPKTFKEDPLRVLRVMQFAGRFGFKPDKKLIKICKSMQGSLKELPSSRITEELKKLLLKSEKPSIGLRVAKETGLFKTLFPEIENLSKCKQDKNWHSEGDVLEHTYRVVDEAARLCREKNLSETKSLTLMLSALTHDFGKPLTTKFSDGRIRSLGHAEAGVQPAKEMLSKLDFPKKINQKVLSLIKYHKHPSKLYSNIEKGQNVSEKAIKRLSVKLGSATIKELVLLAEADKSGRKANGGKINISEVSWLEKRAKGLKVQNTKPEAILRGKDIKKYLYEKNKSPFRYLWKPGPKYSKVLKEVYEAQLDGEIKTKYQALERAKVIGRIISNSSSF